MLLDDKYGDKAYLDSTRPFKKHEFVYETGTVQDIM
jgi:hypothetical protein